MGWIDDPYRDTRKTISVRMVKRAREPIYWAGLKNHNQLHQQMFKRKLSLNGWDTKEGMRRMANVKNGNQNRERKANEENPSSSDFVRTYLKNLLPFTGTGR